MEAYRSIYCHWEGQHSHSYIWTWGEPIIELIISFHLLPATDLLILLGLVSFIGWFIVLNFVIWRREN